MTFTESFPNHVAPGATNSISADSHSVPVDAPLDALHDVSPFSNDHYTEHIDNDLDLSVDELHAKFARMEEDLPRQARRDAALRITENAQNSPTLAIVRHDLASLAARATAHSAIQARNCLAKIHGKAFALGAVTANMAELQETCTPEELHTRFIGPRVLLVALATTFAFEISWNLIAFSELIPGSRLFVDSVAIFTAFLFVLAAHVAGQNLRYGRHHKAAYGFGAFLILAVASATTELSILRANAATAEAKFAALQQSLKSGSSRMFHTDFHNPHHAITFFALSTITVIALLIDVVVSYLAAAPHPAVPRLEALRGEAANIHAELHSHEAAYEAWALHAAALTSQCQSHLDRLNAIYTREFERHRARLERRRRVFAALRTWALPTAAAVGLLLAVTGHAAEMPTRVTYAVLVQKTSIPTAANPSHTTSVQHMYVNWTRTLLIPALRPGDRLIMAPISSDYGLTFTPTIDARLPASYTPFSFRYWFGTGNQRLRLAERLLRIRKQAARLILNGSPSAQACIIASLVRLAPFLMQARGRKDLLLLTDGEDNCGALRFPVAPPTRGLVASLESQGLIPNLFGVHVWVAGAWAPTPRAYRQLKRFWLAYFRRAGAILHENDFAYTLNNFPHLARR